MPPDPGRSASTWPKEGVKTEVAKRAVAPARSRCGCDFMVVVRDSPGIRKSGRKGYKKRANRPLRRSNSRIPTRFRPARGDFRRRPDIPLAPKYPSLDLPVQLAQFFKGSRDCTLTVNRRDPLDRLSSRDAFNEIFNLGFVCVLVAHGGCAAQAVVVLK